MTVTSAAKESDMIAALKRRLRGAIVIAGVGNTLRSDDGAGPRLVEMLRERIEGRSGPPYPLHLVNCRETPENCIGSIARLHPDTVVVVDTASLGLPAGETRIIEGENLSEHDASTHRPSPALFMNCLKKETGADVFVVAVQPALTAFGGNFSPPVNHALNRLADLMESLILRK